MLLLTGEIPWVDSKTDIFKSTLAFSIQLSNFNTKYNSYSNLTKTLINLFLKCSIDCLKNCLSYALGKDNHFHTNF